MPRVQGNPRAVKRVVEKPSFFAYLALVVAFCGMGICRAIQKRRPKSKKQLEAYREWKAGRAEGTLQSKIAKMKGKLEAMRSKRKVEDERDARERLLAEAETMRDTRGREVYGDDWDNPKDGAPIRDLFALTDVEVHNLRAQASESVHTAPDDDDDVEDPPDDVHNPLLVSTARTPRHHQGPPPPPTIPALPAGTTFVSTPREAFGDPDDKRRHHRDSKRKSSPAPAVALVREGLHKGSPASSRRRPPPPPGVRPPKTRPPGARPPATRPPQAESPKPRHPKPKTRLPPLNLAKIAADDA
ncbi:hypothetical protein M885DRAFT_509389 [Pelagophyceae sp. CCMP2097]|nr:hypothetical protein M885DRAFT_509389 [Pelagophyceae sp. CCMP2097]